MRANLSVNDLYVQVVIADADKVAEEATIEAEAIPADKVADVPESTHADDNTAAEAPDAAANNVDVIDDDAVVPEASDSVDVVEEPATAEATVGSEGVAEDSSPTDDLTKPSDETDALPAEEVEEREEIVVDIINADEVAREAPEVKPADISAIAADLEAEADSPETSLEAEVPAASLPSEPITGEHVISDAVPAPIEVAESEIIDIEETPSFAENEELPPVIAQESAPVEEVAEAKEVIPEEVFIADDSTPAVEEREVVVEESSAPVDVSVEDAAPIAGEPADIQEVLQVTDAAPQISSEDVVEQPTDVVEIEAAPVIDSEAAEELNVVEAVVESGVEGAGETEASDQEAEGLQTDVTEAILVEEDSVTAPEDEAVVVPEPLEATEELTPAPVVVEQTSEPTEEPIDSTEIKTTEEVAEIVHVESSDVAESQDDPVATTESVEEVEVVDVPADPEPAVVTEETSTPELDTLAAVDDVQVPEAEESPSGELEAVVDIEQLSTEITSEEVIAKEDAEPTALTGTEDAPAKELEVVEGFGTDNAAAEEDHATISTDAIAVAQPEDLVVDSETPLDAADSAAAPALEDAVVEITQTEPEPEQEPALEPTNIAVEDTLIGPEDSPADVEEPIVEPDVTEAAVAAEPQEDEKLTVTEAEPEVITPAVEVEDAALGASVYTIVVESDEPAVPVDSAEVADQPIAEVEVPQEPTPVTEPEAAEDVTYISHADVPPVDTTDAEDQEPAAVADTNEPAEQSAAEESTPAVESEAVSAESLQIDDSVVIESVVAASVLAASLADDHTPTDTEGALPVDTEVAASEATPIPITISADVVDAGIAPEVVASDAVSNEDETEEIETGSFISPQEAGESATSQPEEASPELLVPTEIERPRSPWTPSYSVITQGSTTSLDVVETKEEEQNESEAAPETSEVVAEAVESAAESQDVPTVTIDTQVLHDEPEAVSELASSVEIQETTIERSPSLGPAEQEEARPASPWTPSYSVTTQGNTLQHDAELDELEQLPASVADLPASQTPTPADEVTEAVSETTEIVTITEDATAAVEPEASAEPEVTVPEADSEAVSAQEPETDASQVVEPEAVPVKDAEAAVPEVEVEVATVQEETTVTELVEDQQTISHETEDAEEDVIDHSSFIVEDESSATADRPEVQVDVEHLTPQEESVIERPRSPWTPSYSVTRQGPGEPEEEEKELAELEQLPSSVAEASVDESVPSVVVTDETAATSSDEGTTPESASEPDIKQTEDHPADNQEVAAADVHEEASDDVPQTFPIPSEAHKLGQKPSVHRLSAVDELSASNSPSLQIEIPTSNASSRKRHESTTSSRFFPGGWFSTSPKVPEGGRTSLEIAAGEFISKAPGETTPTTAIPSAVEEDKEKKSRWCTIM
ncbi:hypothetical protein BV22DRAFT_80986 [Leucogyrophana mollusca]|uniref:Uncharacterized protein n=1 Tax=Leucogyrophana mollusca TaxID=85980 RepID=A0ACB8BXG9_9AGAM|nr:hypothetical protein BV22DRAFT_80986 [Leucogyrophana mollusca]